MKAFVLAAGFGTRLKPVTDTTPKPLVPANGLPLIAYNLALLKHVGLSEVVINLHHLGSQIENALGDGSALGLKISYSYEDPILGTGGGIAKVLPEMSDDFLVINSDLVTDFDLKGLISAHTNANHLATLAVRESADVERFGVLEVSDGVIQSVLGKPEATGGQKTHFTGIHMVNRAQLMAFLEKQSLPETFCIVRDVYIPSLCAGSATLGGFLHAGYWNDCGTFEALTAVENALKKNENLSYVQELGVFRDHFTKN